MNDADNPGRRRIRYPAAFLCLKQPQEAYSFCGLFLFKSGGDTMTLNILFFTVTIQKYKKTAQQCIQEDRSMKIRKEHIDRALMHRRM
jgi:uncharacterized protein (TIGR02413 family)